jgi:uncharacterized protein (TIGR03435 family)
LVAAILIVGGLHTVAQSRLDVVSVRENPANIPPFRVDFVSLPGRLDFLNYSLEDLVMFGYDIVPMTLRDELIVGWPNSWIQRKRFDIQTRLSTNETLSVEGQRRIVLEVLETRFHLRVHREQRLFNGWVMTLAKPGVSGPRLKRVDFNCAEIKREDAPKDKDGRPQCRRGSEYLPGQPLSFHGSGTIDRLAEDLKLTGRRLVVNETGLEGFFVWDIVYNFSPGPGANGMETAVFQDLGIKLEPNRRPASIVVIDDVRMPTPN